LKGLLVCSVADIEEQREKHGLTQTGLPRTVFGVKIAKKGKSAQKTDWRGHLLLESACQSIVLQKSNVVPYAQGLGVDLVING
jgi:hypothetical protein